MEDKPTWGDCISLLRQNAGQLAQLVRQMSRLAVVLNSYTPEQLAGDPIYATDPETGRQTDQIVGYTSGASPTQWAEVRSAFTAFIALHRLLTNKALTGMTGDHWFVLKKFLPWHERGDL